MKIKELGEVDLLININIEIDLVNPDIQNIIGIEEVDPQRIAHGVDSLEIMDPLLKIIREINKIINTQEVFIKVIK